MEGVANHTKMLLAPGTRKEHCSSNVLAVILKHFIFQNPSYTLNIIIPPSSFAALEKY